MKYHQKDKDPKETIIFFKACLKKVGIKLKEVNNKSFGSTCYSVTVGDPMFPLARADGKGISKDLALASAYGEFLERLQNGILYPESFYDSLKIKKNSLTYVSLGDIIINHPNIFNSLSQDKFENTEKIWNVNSRKKIRSEKFFNINTGNIHFLPIQLIKLTCGSNGMCAGNTPEEAVLQGMCEIIERHCAKKALIGDPYSIDYINHEDIDDDQILNTIKEFSKRNYNVIVLDLSDGGKYPVVGALITDKEFSKYKVSFGCAPILTTAISRCLTEISQGYNDIDFNDSMITLNMHAVPLSPKEIQGNIYSMIMNGTGYFSFLLLSGQQSILYKKAFVKKEKMISFSNKEYIEILSNQLQMSNHAEIYIKDSSYLGACSYYVYIPGLSEKGIRSFEQENLINGHHIANYFTNISEPKNAKILYDFITTIKETSYGKVNFSHLSDIYPACFNNDHPIHDLDLETLSFYLSIVLGDLNNALIHLKKMIEDQNENIFLKHLHIIIFNESQSSKKEKLTGLNQILPLSYIKELYQWIEHADKIIQEFEVPYSPYDKNFLKGNKFYKHWTKVTKALSEYEIKYSPGFLNVK